MTPAASVPPRATASPAEPRRVFVIDDDDVMLLSCRRILAKAGYLVETFASGHAGLARLAENPPQLLLVDLKMPEIDGFEVIERVRAIDANIVIAVLTGYATVEHAVEAMQAGAYDFLPKPFTPDELRLLVNRGLERWQLATESARLRRENEEAERRFITFVTHQLKSPVVAAKQYLDVLLFTTPTQLPAQAADWLRRAQTRLGETLALIEDWLTLSRVERGMFCDTAATSDLGDIVLRVVECMGPQAEAAGIALEPRIEPGVSVAGDATSLATIASNLIGNGIKYNRPGGSVTVHVARDREHGLLEVSDTGIGIDPAAVPALFGEFTRIKNEATAEIPGTGLGLAICKRIADELRGTVEVVSEKAVGSRFSVRLPLAEAGLEGVKGAERGGST